jgi:NAD(P)-dependent dehydrogenase (short-subunit alcohol dehydrogenase family)
LKTADISNRIIYLLSEKIKIKKGEFIMELKNKVVVITGASGGMGSVICKKLAAEGAKLALCSVNGDLLEDLVKEIKEKNPQAQVFAEVRDVTKETEVVEFIDAAAKLFGSFDLLINLAGLSIPTNYATIEEKDYYTMMDVNVKGAMLMSKHFARYANNPSRIINTGSMAARVVNANAPIYCIAKAAVNKLSEGLLLQLGKQGIAVSTVNPGGANTAFWGERKVDRTKLMSPEDVAEIFLFVAHLNSNIQLHCIDFESAAKYL